MTTTISLATRDSIVLGCDSLATSIQPVLDPFRVLEHFFEPNGDLKLGEGGKPVLKKAAQFSGLIQRLPRDQLPNVTKIFHLKPLPIGLLFAGSSGIGQHSVKNLIDLFTAEHPLDGGNPQPVKEVARVFFEFARGLYGQSYGSLPDGLKPAMDVILSGYSPESLHPEVYRLNFSSTPSLVTEIADGKFGIAYGGQYDVIQRVVNGVDFQSYLNLRDKSERILRGYRDTIQEFVAANNVNLTLPEPDLSDTKNQIFADDFGGVTGLQAEHDSLSDQAAINFVEFLVDTMIKAQQFSGSLPTVGGDIHIAIITKAEGFTWISKEEYHFRGHAVRKHHD